MFGGRFFCVYIDYFISYIGSMYIRERYTPFKITKFTFYLLYCADAYADSNSDEHKVGKKPKPVSMSYI
jgi:hypothetical protein